jgi:HPt (histidine-containing phosphotransfer) domain-containing protein
MPVPTDTSTRLSADALESAYRAVWEQHREGILTRIELLDSAATALAADRLEPQLRAQARRAAHMLGGALGMFGFDASANAARELQRLLTQTTPADPGTLARLVAELRHGLDHASSV